MKDRHYLPIEVVHSVCLQFVTKHIYVSFPARKGRMAMGNISKEGVLRIAAVSDDGATISQHFGRARFYIVVTVKDGKIVGREKREKIGHADFLGEPHDDAGLRGHGFGPAAQSRHARMISKIADCQALLARGMGAGAYQAIKEAGIRPIVTDIADIEEAVRAYVEGRLIDHYERLH